MLTHNIVAHPFHCSSVTIGRILTELSNPSEMLNQWQLKIVLSGKGRQKHNRFTLIFSGETGHELNILEK